MSSNVLFWKVLSYQRKLDQAARFQLAQLERAALIDNLTTLGNHRAYQEQVPRALDQAREPYETLALALIDVDEFKLINDTYGHAHGDRVLSGLGMLLRDISADAAPYRLGGDEFALLLPRSSLAEAALALEHLCQEAPRRLFGATLSIGIASSTPMWHSMKPNGEVAIEWRRLRTSRKAPHVSLRPRPKRCSVC